MVELGALIVCAYPALSPLIEARPGDLVAIVGDLDSARDLGAYRRLGNAAVGPPSGGAHARRGLRRWAAREKLRVAARELLALPGHDVDVTARELSDLADVCCEIALAEALSWAEERFGTPIVTEGESGMTTCPFVVIGMGKLGGRELNAGSDIDLMLFYESDDGRVDPPRATAAQGSPHTIHEHFTRVAHRFVATLEEPTEDGAVWRVDLRLRPEGTAGALVNSLIAAERYYETWGRTWERAALIRARPVAGDIAFGRRLLGALGPFVWRRAIDPGVVDELAAMLAQSRAEASGPEELDLKIGRGGIREIEFFAQGLQLVWGGGEPRVRGQNTIDALRRLCACGYVTERERSDLSDGYVVLRRLEHRIQFATGQQTHSLPRDPELFERVARSLGYEGTAPLMADLDAVRSRVSQRLASLLVAADPPQDRAIERVLSAIEAQDETRLAGAVAVRFGSMASVDLPRHLMALARTPSSPLGAESRDRYRAFTRDLIGVLADSADPEQATRLLAAFFGRFAVPGAYV
ncbi:MAG: bifunctional [glutamate--ammonia ligase]-adenylyl-L-tyrosine phosphorylase/[glutamate--ammonia-ligase] adenylyltransferase, partial [Polyangiaceae bacterium]